MTKLTSIDRASCRLIGDEMERALAAVAEKFGLKIVRGGATYSTTFATYKFEASVAAEGGAPAGRDAEAFKTSAVVFGFEASDLGKEFVSRGTRYTITGLKPGAVKFPVLAARRDGKTFKFPARTVLRGLGRALPTWMREEGE